MGRPRTDIQPRIVASARARFLHDGVDGASLREIAAAAGTSVGMIHYYFKTKDDLFFAVVEEVYARLLADFSVALAPGGPVRERLGRLFRRFGTASRKEIDVLRLVIREALVSSERLQRLVRRFRAGHLPLVLGALAEGVAQGDVDAETPLPILLMCVAGMAVIPQIVRRRGGDMPPFAGLPRDEALAAITLDLLFRGIGPRTSGPGRSGMPAPPAPGAHRLETARTKQKRRAPGNLD